MTVDGLYGVLNIKDTFLDHIGGAPSPSVDMSAAQQTASRSGSVTFDNDIFDAVPEPSDVPGNSYVSATDQLGNVVQYAVVGGGSTRQTTLAGTTAGSMVWSMPSEGSGFKRFIGHYTGYENTSATAQTVTYPVAFSLPPKITTNDASSGGTNTTALT